MAKDKPSQGAISIPQNMYSKGPQNNPAPMKSYDTSGDHAYGDSAIRMLSGNKDVSTPPVVQVIIKK